MQRFPAVGSLVWALGLVGFQAAPSASPPPPVRAQSSPAPNAPKPRPALALEGTVKGPDGKAVEGALVIARKVGSSDEALSTRTLADGRFRLALPRQAVGPWDVRVEAKGKAAIQLERTQPGMPLLVTLPKGRTVTGTVRDGSGNQPLAGAIVEARSTDPSRFSLPWEPSAGVVATRTDREGRFRLEGLANGLFEIAARAPRHGRAQRRNVRPGASVDLLLFPGASISGIVTGPDARPVTRAVVAAQRRGDWGFEPAGAEITDARGRFALFGVEPGAYLLAVRHPELAPGVADVTVESLADAQVDISLTRGVPVLGRLIADRDRPIPGKVSVEELAGRRVTSRLAEILRAEAGPDGLFVIERLPPGAHVLAVHAPGFAKRRVEVEVGARAASVDLGEIALDRGLVISGRVRSRGGAPIPDASVAAYPMTDAMITPESDEPVRTEADGSFAIGGLETGRFTLSASAPGHASARKVAEAGAEDVRIELAPGGSITGSVVDAQGRAVEAFKVSAERLERDHQGSGGNRVKDVAAADGRFALEDLAEGTYVVRANAPEMAPGTVSDVHVKAGQPSEAGMIRLTRGGIVRGTVVDTTGAAVAGATVTALSGGRMSWMDRVEGSSDGSGSFELLGVRPGRVTITATHPAYAQGRVSGLDVDPAKGPAEARVVLSIGGRVQGSARKRDGTALVGSRVEVVLRRPDEDVGLGTTLTALVQPDGSFLVERVPPGVASVGLATQAAPGIYVSGQRKEVAIVEGQTASVDFTSREVLVSGRVTRSDAPVGGVRVTVSPTMVSMVSGSDADPVAAAGAGPRPFVGDTAEDGSYELIAPEPGDATVTVASLDGKMQHASRYLRIPDALTYTLDFKLGGAPVSGIVVDKETGEGVPGASIYAALKKGEDEGGTTAGPDGRFAFEIAPGEYTVNLWAEGYARSQSDLSVGAGGASEVRFELGRGLVLQGKLVDAAGRPAAGQRVFAKGREGATGREMAMTLADGAFRFDRLQPKAYDLSAGGPAVGYATRGGVSPGDKDVVLALRPGGRVRLAVVDGRGAPVAEAFVRVVSVNGLGVFVSVGSTLTDAAGLLEISSPAGTVEILATQAKGSGKVTVEVSPGVTVPGRIVLRESAPNP
jgi:protocatechuate 3,4-dioxygenase beta subunit